MRLSTLMPAMLLTLAWGVPAHAADLTAEEIAKAVGFTAEDRQRFQNGDIVSADLPETTDTMLAQAVALKLTVPPSAIEGTLLTGQYLTTGTARLGAGKIDPSNPEAGLKDAVFTADESDEVEKLLDAEAGDTLNLSSDEIAILQKLKEAGKTGVEDVSAAYQSILAARVKAFAASGLKGIAPYDRGDSDTSSAASDLEAMTKASNLGKLAPGLEKVLLDYPAGKSADIEEAYFWLKSTVNGRPAFTLLHRMVQKRSDAVIVMDEEYFVGHSYNASLTLAGGFAIPDGTTVFYAARSTSDQLAGFGSSMRHSIGRKMLLDQIEKDFEAYRAKVE